MDGEIPEQPRPSERRVFFLGDSFTEGTVPDKVSMPGLVKSALQRQFANTEVTPLVINVGTLSYSPLIHYVRYRDEIRRYKPKVVVVSVDMTDVFDDYLYRQVANFDSLGEPLSIPSEAPFTLEVDRIPSGLRRRSEIERIFFRLGRNFKLFKILHEQFFKNRLYFSLSDPSLPHVFDWCLPQLSEETSELVRRMLERLTNLVKLIRRDSAVVLITAIPHLEQFTGEWGQFPFDVVRTAAERGGGIYIDSFRVMKAEIGMNPAADLYIPKDMHMNQRGYAIWSKAFVDWFAAHPDALIS